MCCLIKTLCDSEILCRWWFSETASKRDSIQPVHLVVMLKWHTFSLFVCGSQVCHVCDSHGKRSHEMSWPPKPWCTRHPYYTLLSFHLPSVSLHQSPTLTASTAFLWHFKKLCQFPGFPHPQQNVLFRYPLHTLLFSAGTQKMIVAFGFV